MRSAARPAPGDLAQLRRLVAQVRDLPALPGLAARIVAVLEREDADLAEAAALIETDQVLAAQVLRVANSAFYGLSGRIASVEQALTVLGTTVSRSLVYATSMLDLRIGRRGFWEHAVGTAVMAGALARWRRLDRPEEISAAGLLHDLGKVVLFRQAPELFEAVLDDARQQRRAFRESERALLGTDHAEIASWLVGRWRLPPRLHDAVVYHHEPERSRAAPLETAVVHVANSLVRGYGYGYGGDDLVPSPTATAWARLGLERRDIHAVLDAFERDIAAAHATMAAEA